MKKIFVLFLVLISAQCVFAKSKPTPVSPEGGYVGTLPDVIDRFQKSLPTQAAPMFNSIDGFNDKNQIKPAPRDNPAFVNIIIKKDKTAQYINDLNYVIPIIEKLANIIETNGDIQKFSAQSYFLKENVEYIYEKYDTKSESSYLSFKKLLQLNMQVQTVTLLRSESAIYSPYLPYGEKGYIYNSNNIDQQLQYLLKQINDTLIALKEAK